MAIIIYIMDRATILPPIGRNKTSSLNSSKSTKSSNSKSVDDIDEKEYLAIIVSLIVQPGRGQHDGSELQNWSPYINSHYWTTRITQEEESKHTVSNLYIVTILIPQNFDSKKILPILLEIIYVKEPKRLAWTTRITQDEESKNTVSNLDIATILIPPNFDSKKVLPILLEIIYVKEPKKLTPFLQLNFNNPTIIFFNGIDINAAIKGPDSQNLVSCIWINSQELRETRETISYQKINEVCTKIKEIKEIFQELKNNQEELKKNQEELKKNQEELKKNQEELKKTLDVILTLLRGKNEENKEIKETKTNFTK